MAVRAYNRTDDYMILRAVYYAKDEDVERAIENRRIHWARDPAFALHQVGFSVYYNLYEKRLFIFVQGALTKRVQSALSLTPYREDILPYYPALRESA